MNYFYNFDGRMKVSILKVSVQFKILYQLRWFLWPFIIRTFYPGNQTLFDIFRHWQEIQFQSHSKVKQPKLLLGVGGHSSW